MQGGRKSRSFLLGGALVGVLAGAGCGKEDPGFSPEDAAFIGNGDPWFRDVADES